MIDRPSARLQPVIAAGEDPAVVRARARRRVGGVGLMLALAMAATALRGVSLAVDPDPRTLEIATAKRWASVKTQGERGMLLDADGNVLAKSVKHPAVFLDPVAAREQVSAPGGVPLDVLATQLEGLLGQPRDELLETLEHGQGRYVRLARGVHPEVADRVRSERLTRRGVIVEESYRRFYPQGTFASQLIGFVDDSGVGRQGLERYFHDVLAGREVVLQHPVNRWGRVLDLWDQDDRQVEGRRVHTTLDRVIQRAAEQALADIVERHAPLSATAVVVEVRTGRILAMATAPSFDPNDLGALAPEDFARTQNLAVGAAVEPGSVFKPFTLAAALEAGLTTLDTVLDTTSPYVVGGARIRDDHPEPRMTAAEMIKYSSNIGAAKLGQKVGADRLLATYAAFGFGERSGIDTQGEAAGVRRPRGHFGPVELATISFGQGVTATALQLAMATAALANDGVRLKPLLVDRVTDAFSDEVRRYEPVVVQRVVSANTARKVTAAMELVVEDGGTGTRARIPGYRVAGKTGTAQKVKDGRYSAARYGTYIGFAPSDRPEVAMAVIVDEPTVGSRYGGIVAAPAFAAVVGTALRHRGVPPDPALLAPLDLEDDDALADVGERSPVSVVWKDEAWALPDLGGRALRDVLVGLQGTGLRLDVQGVGVLASQEPRSGALVRPGDTVRLRFASP